MLATKDTKTSPFFNTYCSEAQITRRLNDVGCKNVIKVLDWGEASESVKVNNLLTRSQL